MVKKNKIYIIICMLLILILPIKEVFAETGILTKGKPIYYNIHGIYDKQSRQYVNWQKTLTTEDGINHEAYCVQYGKATPSTGSKMTLVEYKTIAGQNWTEEKAIRAGAIIDYVNSLPNLDYESKLTYTHTSLNKFLNFNGARTNYDNTILNQTIAHASSKVFYKSSKLTETTVQVKFQKNILDKGTQNGKTYYYGNATINIANKYPSYVGEITYTPTCTNCKLYTDSKMKTEVKSIKVAPGKSSNVTYYVRTTDNLGTSTKINLTVSASKSFTYSTAKLWYYNSSKQMVVTAHPKTYTGSIKTTATATTPSSKKVTFYKINSIGDELPGANIKVELNNTNGTTIGSCTTNGKSECSFNFTDNISKATYKITEITTPAGYIKEAPITKEWQIGTTSNTCYKVPIENKEGEWIPSSVTDCETSYIKKEVCLDKDNKLISNIEDSATCVKDNTPTEPDTELDKDDNTLGGEEDSGNGDGNQSGNSGNEGENSGNESGIDSQNMTSEKEETFGSGSEEDDSDEEKEPVEIINNKWETKCLNDKNEIVADEKCNYDYALLTTKGDNLSLEMTNTLNSVKISKTDKNGKNIEGAKLKICEEKTYKEKNKECEPYTTVDNTKLTWYTSLAVEAFHGFKIGTYYLIEEQSPLGYKFDNTVIEFKIDEYGKVELAKDSKAKLEDNTIIFENELTSFSISKQDITTSKELKGAHLSICEASNEGEDSNGKYEIVLSDNGECVPVVLANGEFAEWVSTDKPYIIKGLAAGAYYLVEIIAPTDYLKAESILFFMNEDGTVTDKDGKSLKDSKIVMYDKIIEGPKTKDIALFTIISFILASLGLSAGSYYYLQNNKKI